VKRIKETTRNVVEVIFRLSKNQVTKLNFFKNFFPEIRFPDLLNSIEHNEKVLTVLLLVVVVGSALRKSGWRMAARTFIFPGAVCQCAARLCSCQFHRHFPSFFLSSCVLRMFVQMRSAYGNS
jgi:hypothetical protein